MPVDTEETAASAAVATTQAESPPAKPPTEASVLEKYGHPAEEPPTTAKADEGKPAEEEITTKPAEEQPAEEEAEVEPDLEKAPDGSDDFAKFKPLYKEHPELRAIVGRHQAFTELFPEFSEARQLREWFPTLEDAERTLENAQQIRALGESFRDDPEGFAQTLRELDGNAFERFTAKFPEILYRVAPQVYASQVRQGVNDTLENVFAQLVQDGHKEHAQSLADIAQSYLAYRLGQATFAKPARPDPRDAELERLRREAQEREQVEQRETFQQFVNAVESEYMETSLEEIQRTLESKVPDASEERIERMVKETWDTLQERLKAQPQTLAYVRNAYQASLKGRSGPAEQKALSDYVVKRAKATLPSVLREVIDAWSKSVLGARKTQIDKQRQIAERTKDAGAGAQGSGAAKPPTRAAGPRTEQQILDDLARGAYQPRPA